MFIIMLKYMFSFVFIFGVAFHGSTAKSLYLFEGNDGIIGGREVDITEYPHQVVLLFNGSLLCGGSILNEEYVLTAAHCATRDLKDYTVRVGSTYHAKGGVLHKVSDITIHPEYNKAKKFDSDVAVFKLSEKIHINGNTTKAVQLAKSDSTIEPKDLVDVTGWGWTEKEQPSDVLKVVTVAVVDKEHCQKIFGGRLTDRMLCAGTEKPGQNSCFGDSGGPLIDKKSSMQFGVVSFTRNKCMDPGVPNVYAYVPALRDWIHKVTGV